MKVSIYTLGCKVNAYESEYIIDLFRKNNYEICDFDDVCDVYIINTCTVTSNGDKKCKKMIHHARKLNPDACLVVCGCFIENSKDFNLDDVDIVVGNANKSKIFSFVEDFLKNKKRIVSKEDIMHAPFDEMEIDNSYNHTRAFVKIQDGCENYCSYCIIPFVRGRCRSKALPVAVHEIKTLVSKGFKEIVLTGIHTGNYGVEYGLRLSDLLEELVKIEGLKRLRISSIEITELDDGFLKMLENSIICNHLHIPLQNGSERILKLMNRKYDKKYFLDKINKIREIRPDISITTDVIVGFPDETEEDFLENLDFIKKVNFSKIHTFPYSKREGTRAARMDNQIDSVTKKERVRKQIALSEYLERKYKEQFIGKTLDVLIEKYEDGYSYGYTSNYIYLKIKKKLEPNHIYDVCITSSEMFYD